MNDKQGWRLSIQLTPEQEKSLVELKKRDEFCRMSFGAMVRELIDIGLKANKVKGHDA